MREETWDSVIAAIKNKHQTIPWNFAVTSNALELLMLCVKEWYHLVLDQMHRKIELRILLNLSKNILQKIQVLRCFDRVREVHLMWVPVKVGQFLGR